MPKKLKPKRPWELNSVRGHRKSPEQLVARLDPGVIIKSLFDLVETSIERPLSDDETMELGRLRAQHDERGLADAAGPSEWTWAYAFEDNAGLWAAAKGVVGEVADRQAAAMRAAATVVATDRLLTPSATRLIAEALA